MYRYIYVCVCIIYIVIYTYIYIRLYIQRCSSSHTPKPFNSQQHPGLPKPVQGVARRDQYLQQCYPKMWISKTREAEDTLWWTYKKLWKITIFNGKIHYKSPFSIAMLNYQRVSPRKNWAMWDEMVNNNHYYCYGFYWYFRNQPLKYYQLMIHYGISVHKWYFRNEHGDSDSTKSQQKIWLCTWIYAKKGWSGSQMSYDQNPWSENLSKMTQEATEVGIYSTNLAASCSLKTSEMPYAKRSIMSTSD